MHAESDFYQISGYRAHSNGWFKMYDDKPMMREIMAMDHESFRPGGRDTPVELVLGILPSGASYLLISSRQMHVFTRKHHLAAPSRKAWTARDFISLSPIYFGTLDTLSAKVATYKQRPRNKNRRAFEEPEDNSQANRGYVKTGVEVVHYRGDFEQQRTLYRLLARDLDPGKVGLVPPPWLQGGVRVVSLVFGEWIVDNRPRSVRLSDPVLVDVGWTDAQFPSFFERLAGDTVHLKLKSGRINPGAKDAYFSQVVEDDQAGLHVRLRNLLSHDANKSGMPVIVLVHDEEMARSVLLRAGIDVDSWTSGLSSLLQLPPPRNRPKIEEGTSNLAILPGPSVVDMQKLVKAVMETSAGHTVPHSAKVLHMQTDTKTCAGDDSLLLLRMWASTAQGLAIDEQHNERSARQPDCAQVLAPPQPPTAQAGNAEVGPDDDVDPNDIAPGPRPTIADDFSDDDDW